jgi:hypothetical protein
MPVRAAGRATLAYKIEFDRNPAENKAPLRISAYAIFFIRDDVDGSTNCNG